MGPDPFFSGVAFVFFVFEVLRMTQWRLAKLQEYVQLIEGVRVINEVRGSALVKTMLPLRVQGVLTASLEKVDNF